MPSRLPLSSFRSCSYPSGAAPAAATFPLCLPGLCAPLPCPALCVSPASPTGLNLSDCQHGEHWSIENSLHWILDVAFDEDHCRARRDNAAENFSTLRRMALSLLKQDKSAKVGIQVRQLKAAWDNDYLLSLLQQ